ncbi:SMC-Scp complex subunit ScpB [Paracoccus gahaiensis]|uniref:SMC-Scp complex subunit ScpB n=1 Tax=Paracoccus gahaiensis TaxID=1706839 RepID=A0A4U0RFL0_9RHOB|nr:SMC-Scp complex subunit ScpB [Paracoccus gahaiensis]TJZ93482.1 SMC-Scp complex subunit ScpB [Paracoccus gahaiensis]
MTTAPDAPPPPSPAPSLSEQERMVEAILFAATRPVTLRDLAARMPHGCDPAEALAGLQRLYAGRGVVLERIGEGHAFRTAPDLSFLMQTETVETRRLSRPAVETLAIIAYHQPVTRTEIEEVRGVAVSRGTLDQLIEMGWVRMGRRRMSPGRPATFVVTEEFLDHFGLESARDLPGLSELRAAGLLDSRPLAGGLGPPLAGEAGDDDMEPEGLGSVPPEPSDDDA